MNTTTDNSYTKTLIVEATAKDVFHALTDPDAITSWWSAASTTGSGHTGGELHISFGTEEQPTVMRVLAAHHPDVVIWDVAASPLVPEWVGTRPTFSHRTRVRVIPIVVPTCGRVSDSVHNRTQTKTRRPKAAGCQLG